MTDWVLISRYDPDGRLVSRMNVTHLLGTDLYDPTLGWLRTAPGTVDSTEADEAHRRLTIAQERYQEAEMRWLEGRIGRGPRVDHPGSLADYMPEEET